MMVMTIIIFALMVMAIVCKVMVVMSVLYIAFYHKVELFPGKINRPLNSGPNKRHELNNIFPRICIMHAMMQLIITLQ